MNAEGQIENPDGYWPVKWDRYERQNHTGSPMKMIPHSWFDLDLVVKETVEAVG